jgi:hypothetical protein
MKKFSILLSPILFLILVSLGNIAYAQVASGPSDATTPPPTSASLVGEVLCAGAPISITVPSDPLIASYQWYKIDASGNKQLTTTTGRTYTETPTTAGYYNYQVVSISTSGCNSPISDVFKVYVLPPLSVTITPAVTKVCAGVGTDLLTANVTPSTGYVINYQWTKDGTPIAGATSSTYTTPVDPTAGTDHYGVNVSYALDSSCTASASQDVEVDPIPTKPVISAN